MQEINIA